MVIYQKANGKLLYRARRTPPQYGKGQKNSYGWIVKDIQVLYKGKCYTTAEYDNKLEHRYKIYKMICAIDKTSIYDMLKLIVVLMVLYKLFVK